VNVSNYLRDLTAEAKWGTDSETQKRSIEELGSYGNIALPSLEEIMVVSSRDEIRQHCIDAIRGIERMGLSDDKKDDNKVKADNENNGTSRKRNVRKASRTSKTKANKR
jgi:hypothetical protein